MAQGRATWLALGTAGAIGAAAMYGISKMNRNGTFEQITDQIGSSDAFQQAKSYVPAMSEEETERETLFPQ